MDSFHILYLTFYPTELRDHDWLQDEHKLTNYMPLGLMIHCSCYPTEISEALFRINTVANLPHTPWSYGLADAPQATTL